MHAKAQYWSPQLRAQVVHALEGGASIREASNLMRIPYSTVADWAKRAKCGLPLDDQPKSGRPRAIEDFTLKRICAAVDANPFLSNLEIVRRFRLPCTAETVNTALAEHDPPYTWKEPSLDNANYTEENLMLNVKWGEKMRNVPLDLRLYEDEAGILDNEVPARARAVKGKRVYLPRKSRGKLFQYAITIDQHSLLHPPYVSRSSFSDEPFKNYALQCVVPHVTKGMVVIWDQLGRSGRKLDPDKQHFNPEVRSAIEGKGGQLWLLPPYGKFWNPAEHVHHFLKSRIRQMYSDSDAFHEGRLRTREELEADLLSAADEVDESMIAGAWRNRANGREFKEHFPHLYGRK